MFITQFINIFLCLKKKKKLTPLEMIKQFYIDYMLVDNWMIFILGFITIAFVEFLVTTFLH
jgi:hypothetical protein